MIYLTYNDPPSGVYFSQVTDVCRFYRESLQADIRLVALISIRGFFRNRARIKKELPDAVVLPMFPRLKNWPKNIWTLRWIVKRLKQESLIARGPYAANMALVLRRKKILKKVCFDGRGAYAAELNEFSVVSDDNLKRDMAGLESKAVLQSDFRIAVSRALIRYWEEKYQYQGNEHVIIPCTLSSRFRIQLPEPQRRDELKRKLGGTADDIFLVYAGSSAGWQSFTLLDEFLILALAANEKLKALILAPVDPGSLQAFTRFPGRVIQKWVDPEDVPLYLQVCDHGLLIREDAVTNQVAAPTKFAEYLGCGLPVLIAEKIGDYSSFVQTHQCGMVIDPGFDAGKLLATTDDKRKAMLDLASQYFTKNRLIGSYRRVLQAIR